MFEWLKVAVKPTKPAAGGKKKASASAHALGEIKVDSRTYPLLEVTRTAFIAGGCDHTLAVGQRAKVTVIVNDHQAKFNFPATVEIAAGKTDDQFIGSWTILAPEVETALANYLKYRKALQAQAAAKR